MVPAKLRVKKHGWHRFARLHGCRVGGHRWFGRIQYA